MPKLRSLCLALSIAAALTGPGSASRHLLAAEIFHPDGYDARKGEEDSAKAKERRDAEALAKSREPWRNQDLTNRQKPQIHDISELESMINAQKRRDVDKEKNVTINNVYNHAFAEHAIEYGNVSPEQFRHIAREHLDHPDDVSELYKGQVTAYWSDKHNSVLLMNHEKPESSTMFKPEPGKKYYEYLKRKYGP